MKHISGFNKFNEDNSKPEFRRPKEVSLEDFHKKIRTFGKAKYTPSEVDFLNKVGDGNTKSKIYEKEFIGSHFIIRIKNYRHYLHEIEITKLDDEWYLISHLTDGMGSKYYICDEWEEVLGYLTDRNLIKL